MSVIVTVSIGDRECGDDPYRKQEATYVEPVTLQNCVTFSSMMLSAPAGYID